MNQNLKPIVPKGLYSFVFPFFLLLLLSSAVIQPVGLRVRQSGNQLILSFPPLVNRSAVKVMNLQGHVVKGALIDERAEKFQLPLDSYKKGIHQVTIENRVQRFTAKVLLQ
jgi:hypothetical protein